MVCRHCGKEISDRSVFCPVCGGKVERIGNSAAPQPAGVSGAEAGFAGEQGGLAANNLFARFSRDKNNKGLLCEMILWGTLCFALLLCAIDIVLVFGRLGYSDDYIALLLLWIFVFLFEAGLGVFMAFRWRGISILYGIILFLFIMLIPFYIEEMLVIGWRMHEGMVVFLMGCFALALMTSIGLIVCGILEFVTKINMKLAVFICSIVDISFIACIVALPYFFSGEFGRVFGYLTKNGFLFGSLSYFFVCCIVSLYTIFYCRGMIDSDKGDLFHTKGKDGAEEAKTGEGQAGTAARQAGTAEQQALVGIQCIHGNYQGQTFPVQGEIIIGSQPGSAHIVLQDAYVSKQHCRIRFNAVSGNYELIDLSTNGVYLENGVRLQSNMYHSCPRGTVLYLGSKNQKYKLL